jgi:hypothetical protein
MKRLRVLLGSFLVCSLAPTLAQVKLFDHAEYYRTNWIDFSKLDFAVPEAAAFVGMGVAPEQVLRPGVPRDFAASILNGLDPQGNFQTGIAVETMPYLLLAAPYISMHEYRTNYWQRFFTRMQLSFGTAKGIKDEDESTRLGLGLRLTFFDLGDPRMSDQLDQAFKGTARMVPPPTSITPEGLADYQKRVDEETRRLQTAWRPLQDDFRAQNWNRSRGDLAIAPSFIKMKDQDIEWDGLSVWSSLAYGFDKLRGPLRDNAYLVFHVRYKQGEHIPIPDEDNEFFRQDSLLLGTRLQFGGKNFTGSFEGAYVHTWPDDFDQDDFFRIAFALEKRITDNVWLVFSLGKNTGSENTDNDLFAVGSLKFGYSTKSAQNTAR